MGRGQGAPDTLVSRDDSLRSLLFTLSYEPLAVRDILAATELERSRLRSLLKSLANDSFVRYDGSHWELTTRGCLAVERSKLDIPWSDVLETELERIGSQAEVKEDTGGYLYIERKGENLTAAISFFSLLTLLEDTPSSGGDAAFQAVIKAYELGHEDGVEEERSSYSDPIW